MSTARWAAVFATTSAFAGCHAIVGIEDPAAGGAGATSAALSGGGGIDGPIDAVNTTSMAGPASVTSTTSAPASGSTGTGSPYADLVLADGPLLYFRFEEASGDVIDEVTSLPKGAVFTYDGATSTPGGTGTQRGLPTGVPNLGNGILFTGSSDASTGGYVLHTSATNLAFDGTAPFTLELWAAVALSNDVETHPISNVKDTTKVSDGYLFILAMDAGTTYATGIRTWANNASGFSVAEVSGVTATQMHHYAFTYDGTSTRIYVDGLTTACSYTNCTLNGALSTTVGAALTIGGTWTGVDGDVFNDNFVAGMIDEVAIYDRALSAPELGAHIAASGM